MNITVTLQADKKLLEAIVLIATALSKTNPATPAESTTQEPAKKPSLSIIKEEPKTSEPVKEESEPDTVEILDIAKVRAIAAEVSQAGKKEAIKGVLKEMNVTRVTDLKENQFNDFVSKVKAL